MVRKAALVAVAVFIQAGIVVGVSGTAWAVPPRLIGTTNCAVFKGTGNFGPKLTVAGTSPTVKISFTGTLAGCVGVNKRNGVGAPVTITGGTVTGSGYFTGTNASKCANFEGPPPAAGPTDRVGRITMTVNWAVVGPAVQASNVTYGVGIYHDPTLPLAMWLELGRPLEPAPVVGSFFTSVIQHTIMKITTNLAHCSVGSAFAFPAGIMRF